MDESGWSCGKVGGGGGKRVEESGGGGWKLFEAVERG